MRKKELLDRIEKLERELAEIRATAPFIYIPYVPPQPVTAPYTPWPHYPQITYSNGALGMTSETFTAFNGGAFS